MLVSFSAGVVAHLGMWLGLAVAGGQAAAPDPLEATFAATVRPFLQTYCTGCHGKDKPKGQVDLTAYRDVRSVARDHRQWETVLSNLTSLEMPPAKAERKPGEAERAEVVAWIQALRRREAERNAGDPGPVLPRRLSNAEYDYTIRDLLGVDLRPTREFPVDPANEAGFDNSGESLAMSPALMKKYLEAAREIADHLVLKPQGFSFASHPVLSETERDKYAVLRIVDFYNRQPTDLARYFEAAWGFHHRARLGKPGLDLAAWAVQEKVSPKYLATVYRALTATPAEVGPLARVQARWRQLPAPAGATDPQQLQAVRAECGRIRDYVVALRDKIAPRWRNLNLKGVGIGSQPFVLWRNTQYATHRTSFDPSNLYAADDPAFQAASAHRAQVAPVLGVLITQLQALSPASKDAYELGRAIVGVHENLSDFVPDPELQIPPGPEARARYEAAFAQFAKVFPDAFYVSERDRPYLDRPKERQLKGRLLGAGYHNMMGYFRDDIPLYELILDRAGQRELDQLWRELDFITFAPTRQHADFIFYERAEGPKIIRGAEWDFAKSENPAMMTPAGIARLAEMYLAKARTNLKENGGDAIAIPVLEDFFRKVATNIQRAERDRQAAQPSHLQALTALAERAYRRPLLAAERDGLLAFYRTLRSRDHLDHEQAIRDSVASVFTSPHFLYRLDLDTRSRAMARGRAPGRAQEYALASRLSYFLWSSMPDGELMAHAAAGDLHRPEVLAAQARRLLRDPKARALAVEFGGNWLDFRRFEEHNGVDRERFPTFDDDLRRAMFEEPVRFFTDVFQRDRSVLDLLYATDTFVNAPLARHYGMPAPEGDAWVQVTDADRYGRGGLLPMAVFLTRNAPGLRTSPVKRGYWVVRRVLGEQIPPPPAQVPDLPNDERQMGNLTLPQMLARHRQDKACAGCHNRFDSFGLSFEGFGPVGEARTRDLGGRPVDTHAAFPGGGEGTGVAGLREHLRERRQDDFLDNVCRKLLSYGLSRTLIPSDEATVRQMRARLAASGNRFGVLVDEIVTSPQFLGKRVGETLAKLDTLQGKIP